MSFLRFLVVELLIFLQATQLKDEDGLRRVHFVQIHAAYEEEEDAIAADAGDEV